MQLEEKKRKILLNSAVKKITNTRLPQKTKNCFIKKNNSLTLFFHYQKLIIMKKLLFSVGCFLLFQCSINAQLFEISLQEQVKSSSLIVEGFVTKSESFLSDEREIFTAHEIKISKTFKGDTSKDFVTIITRGGAVDDITTTWTHLLTLQEGQEGVFFLKNTPRPMIQNNDFPNDKLEAYSSSQGFYQYHTLENKNIIVANPFTRYENLNDFYNAIQNETGQLFASKDDDRNEKRTGIRYVFKNFEIEDNKVNFEVYVNGLYNNYKLYQSGIILKYNDFFGHNVASNGYLQTSPLDMASPSSYNLSLSDYSDNIIMFKLDYFGGAFSEIDTYEKPFAKGSFQMVNPTVLPEIYIDLSQVNSLNRYYDESTNTSVPFDTIIVEHEFKGFGNTCFPLIDSFTPDTVAAGIGQVLTIRGECFGDYVDGVSRVQFLNAFKGGGAFFDQWCSPIAGDYELWTDTLIKVKVPSVGWDGVPVITQLNVAGSGPFQVCNKDDECIFSNSAIGQSDIFVKYAARNTWTEPNESPSERSLPVSLIDRNGEGGVSLIYDNTMTSTEGAVDAFERSLNTWKCNTRVNFNTDQSISNTNPADTVVISFRNLPTGVFSTTLGLTYPTTSKCKDLPSGIFIRGELKRFRIEFNDSLNWYFDEDLTNFDTTIYDYDFQSTALHELGHAHLFKHVMDKTDIMYYAKDKGEVGRALNEFNIEGGQYIMDISSFNIAGSNCNSAMIGIDTTGLGCYLINSIYNISNKVGNLSVYPNPTTENLTFNFESKHFENVKITIMDIYGRKVKELLYHKTLGQLTDTLSLMELPSGMYILNITLMDSRQFISKQFIKL